VLNTFYHSNRAGGDRELSVSGIPLAFAYTAMLCLTYPISGGCLNPAIGFAMTMQGAFWKNKDPLLPEDPLDN